MNRASLIRLLEVEGVRSGSYSIDRQPQDESLCLEIASGGWIVYYSERRLRTGECDFETEDEACEFMAQELLASGANRIGYQDPKASNL